MTGRFSAFDDLARSTDQLSRRQVVKLGAGLAIAGVLPAWARPRKAVARMRTLASNPTAQAAAGATGNCNIPPDSNCKIILSNTNGCPAGRIVQGNIPLTYNGCGSTSFEVPDGPLGLANFNPACNNHDCCYSECHKAKSACDQTFQDDMYKQCYIAHPGVGANGPDVFDAIALVFCLQVADDYYEGVNLGAGSAYKAAQGDGCGCCADCPPYEIYDSSLAMCVSACRDSALGPDACPCLPDRQVCIGPDAFYCTDRSSNSGDCGECANQCVRDLGGGISQGGTCQNGQCVYPDT